MTTKPNDFPKIYLEIFKSRRDVYVNTDVTMAMGFDSHFLHPFLQEKVLFLSLLIELLYYTVFELFCQNN